MIPYSLPAPSNAKPKIFTVLFSALVVLTVTYLLERGSYWYRHLQTPHTLPRSDVLDVEIGPLSFLIPIGYIHADYQRHAVLNQGTGLAKIGLSITWPQMGMVEPSDTRLSLDNSTQIIQAVIENNAGRETLRAQLDPVYRRLARGGEMRGPSGLNILILSAPTSALQDQIVYDRSRKDGFIARCVQKTAWSNAICHRVLPLGSGLEFRYRFDQELLPDWRSLDMSMSSVIETFRKPK